MAKLLPKNIKIGAAILSVCAFVLLIANYLTVHTEGSRTVELTYSFTISDIPENAKKIKAWVPVPLSNEHQKLHSTKVLGDWPYKTVRDKEYNNRFLVFDLNNEILQSDQILISIKFLITRHPIVRVHHHSSVGKLTKNKLARYLAPDRLVPIDGKIAKEAFQTAGHTQNPLKQARLLYDHIVKTLSYDKSGTGWGRGDAIYACDIRKGNCTDFHSLFIGQIRALNIPARFIMGLPMPQDKTRGNIPGYHCWGEFYLPKKGWLPIDASEANRFPEKKELFFGGLDENRIAFTIGRDIKLPGSAAEPSNYVIYPHVEIDGKIHNSVKKFFVFRDISL